MSLPTIHAVWRAKRALRPKRGTLMEDALGALGHAFLHVNDGAVGVPPEDVLLMRGNAHYFPATFRRLQSLPPEGRPGSVLFHSEPLPAPAASGLRPARRHAREWLKLALRDPRTTDPRSNWARLESLQRLGLPTVIAVSTPARQTFLAEQGIDAVWAPFGWYEQMGTDLGLERDIDVMFLGAQDVPRRRRIVRELRRAGIEVATEGGWSAGRGLWGEERTRTLNRVKILLNLGRHPGELSGLRLLKGMGCRCCVLSEPIYDPRPYVPGVHYVEAPVGELAEAARALLADDARREAIADAGYAFATTEQTFARRTAPAISEAVVRAARRETPPPAATPPPEVTPPGP